MAERRAGPFPRDGEEVIADDGTVWLFDEGAWVPLGTGMSRAAGEGVRDFDRAVRQRLWRALAVWELARDAVATVKSMGPDMRKSDPLPQWVELVARAAFEDAVAETCDGGVIGQEQQTLRQLHGLLGPAMTMRVVHAVQRLRARLRGALRAVPS